MERALYLSEREEEMKQYTKQLFPFLFSVQIGGAPFGNMLSFDQ